MDLYNRLNVDDSKQIYVGDQYGYTGANCTFICMYEALKSGKLNRGDWVLIWTAGFENEFITSLIQF